MVGNRTLIGAALAGSLAGAGLALPGVAHAATTEKSVTVPATDDSYVSSSRRTVNFGAADKLVVGRADGETRVSLLKFTVGALATGASLKSAEVRLPVDGRPVASTLSLLRVPSNSWSQRTVTDATAPATGETLGSLRPAATDTALRFDVSRLVKGPGTYSFALKSTATTAVTQLRSVERGAGGPELRLTVSDGVVPRPPVNPPAGCATDRLLVPSCGVLWGAAAGAFTDTPRDEALRQFETTTGRTAAIFHTYHKGDEKFPTASEIAMTRDPARSRVLLLNWKVAYGSTWAKVAAGEKDARIKAFADRVKAGYPEKFFLALHHEPENDVQAAAGSGMTAKDYAAMYRHVVTLLRARGVSNAINVIAFMGNEKWLTQSWWKDLYPGDEYVDWMGLDSYVSVEKGAYHYGDFASLLDRSPADKGVGFYDWATTQHPGKPLMVAEWGMYHRTSVAVDKAPAFRTVLPQLLRRPNIKAIVYFDCVADDEGDRNISIGTTASGLAAFRELAANPIFNVTLNR